MKIQMRPININENLWTCFKLLKILQTHQKKFMDRFMLHLENSNYTPNDANNILLNSRDLAYGMNLIIRDYVLLNIFFFLKIRSNKFI